MHAKATASNHMAKAHSPRVRAKERASEVRGNPKKIQRLQGAKGSYKGETSKTGLSGLENPKSETCSGTQESAQTCPADTSWKRWLGVMMNTVITGVLLDGTNVGH